MLITYVHKTAKLVPISPKAAFLDKSLQRRSSYINYQSSPGFCSPTKKTAFLDESPPRNCKPHKLLLPNLDYKKSAKFIRPIAAPHGQMASTWWQIDHFAGNVRPQPAAIEAALFCNGILELRKN